MFVARRLTLFVPIFGILSLLASDAVGQRIRVGPLGGVSIQTRFGSLQTLPFGLGTSIGGPLGRIDTGLYGWSGVGGYAGYPPYAPRRYGYDAYGYRSYGIPSYWDQYPVGRYGYGGYRLDGYRSDAYRDSYRIEQLRREARLQANLDAQREAMYRAARPRWESSYDRGNTAALAQPPVDTRAEVALRLRQAAARLARSIDARPEDAEVWHQFLQPRTIVDVIDGLGEDDGVEVLESLWQRYEGTAGDPQWTHVWSMEGFEVTHRRLREWLDGQHGITQNSVSGVSPAAPVIQTNPTTVTNPTTPAAPVITGAPVAPGAPVITRAPVVTGAPVVLEAPVISAVPEASTEGFDESERWPRPSPATDIDSQPSPQPSQEFRSPADPELLPPPTAIEAPPMAGDPISTPVTRPARRGSL